MKYLFSPEGKASWAKFVCSGTLFAFDYDGTLAPIVENPQEAWMRPEEYAALRGLAQSTSVAIVSGRKQSELKGFVPAEVSFIVGNHGFEGLSASSETLKRAVEACRDWKQQILRDLLPHGGWTLEDKSYSLTLHYRQAADPEAMLKQLETVVHRLDPQPRLLRGKCVLNLLWPEAPDKGDALLELMQKAGCHRAVFLGDDDNDEDVFRLPADQVLSIRVGFLADSRAPLYLNDQLEVKTFLEKCLHILGFDRRST